MPARAHHRLPSTRRIRLLSIAVLVLLTGVALAITGLHPQHSYASAQDAAQGRITWCVGGEPATSHLLTDGDDHTVATFTGSGGGDSNPDNWQHMTCTV